MVKFLKTDGGLSLSDVHIMGASLGAHIAGFAGAYNSGLIGRITGLDAAGPLFETPRLKDPVDRLDKTDAVFVDNIHTCGGIAGFLQPIGHVDFYPNNGTIPQPGCPLVITGITVTQLSVYDVVIIIFIIISLLLFSVM